MKSLRLILALSVLFTTYSHGATLVTFLIDSGNRILRDSGGTALTAGTTATGDGAVVQIGYYTSSTVGNNFGSGGSTWRALTGQGSLFGVVTSIGDTNANGAVAGKIFTDDLNIFTGTNGGMNDFLLPTAGQVMSIRFYDTTNTSGFFNAVSNNTWLWQSPGNSPNQPVISLAFDDVGLVAQSGAVVAAPGTTINTTIAQAPEPTSATLLLVGLVSLASRRRRVAKV